MRLLYLVHQFPPQFSTGTEVLTLETAKAQKAAGHDIEILTAELSDQPVDPSATFFTNVHDGITVHRYPYYQPNPDLRLDSYRAEYANRYIQRHLRARLEAFSPDLVHAFHLCRISTEAVSVVRKANIPLVLSITDFWPICPVINLRLPDGSMCQGPNLNSFNCLRHLGGAAVPAWAEKLPAAIIEAGASVIRRWQNNGPLHQPVEYAASLVLRQRTMRSRLRQIQAIIVASGVGRRQMLNLGIPATRLHDLPFGINLDYLKAFPGKTPSSRLRIGFIGTIAPPKGLHVLAQAFRQLPEDLAVELRIHGRFTDDPSYAQQMQSELVSDPRVIFLGPFPNREIGEVLASIDVLVVPSIWQENTPLVISTAQAAKTPVIATDLEGLSESVRHDHNGLLFPLGDHFALSKLLLRLANEPYLLARLAGNARLPASIADYAASLRNIYQRIISIGDD